MLPPMRVRYGCATRCGRRGSRLPIAPASWSTCVMPKWRGSKSSTRRSIPCSRKFPTVVMGRDKRIYRLVQDSRFGRIVIAESHEVAVIVGAVTDYVARRMIERERALVATPMAEPAVTDKPRRSRFWTFALGFVVGVIALFGLALFAALRNF